LDNLKACSRNLRSAFLFCTPKGGFIIVVICDCMKNSGFEISKELMSAHKGCII
jgi:hypothetical protein